MPTVKEIKKDLDALGIEYPSDALKGDLEDLVVAYDLSQQDRPVITKAPTPEAVFVDPNSNPATQAK